MKWCSASEQLTLILFPKILFSTSYVMLHPAMHEIPVCGFSVPRDIYTRGYAMDLKMRMPGR